MKKLCLCLALASLLGLGGQAFALIGTADVVPAATLLLPYFEVDLATCDTAASAGNTLFSINNASDAAVLTHVTVWSDQSIPVLDFDVYLTGFDVQTLNLCDILKSGNLPRTAPSNTDPAGTALNAGISPRGSLSPLPQGDIPYAGCVGVLPYTNPALNPAFRAHLQQVLQGFPSPTFGTCYASKIRDGVLRGYVTVDTVNNCNVLFPSQMIQPPVQYRNFITNENTLWGDWFIVNSAENFAQGDTLVHIESCGVAVNGRPGSQYFGCDNVATIGPSFIDGTAPNNHTFYGRYDGGVGFNIDAREALPTTMGARYLNGGGFTGGTDFLVWREGGGTASAASYPCAQAGPAWHRLGSTQIVVFDEQEQPVTPETCPSGFDCSLIIEIPEETQRVDVGLDIITPFNFGWVYLNLQDTTVATSPYTDGAIQMWLTTIMDASGRFSVGFAGVAFDNANAPISGLIPLPPP